jgi:hypothetical protein
VLIVLSGSGSARHPPRCKRSTLENNMTTTTLNAVAIDVVGQYGLASKHLVQAYRLGTQRVVEQINERYSSLVNASSLPMVDESIRASLLNAHQQFTGFFVGGVARATEQADLAIDKITDGTTQGIKRLGDAGERFEAMVGAPVVDAMTKVNMPIAQMSLQIAGQVVENSKRLVERVAATADLATASVEAVAAAAGETKSRAKRAAA